MAKKTTSTTTKTTDKKNNVGRPRKASIINNAHQENINNIKDDLFIKELFKYASSNGSIFININNYFNTFDNDRDY